MVAACCWAAVSVPGAASPKDAAPPAITISAKTRALIISPHPDDAVLGAGGLIQRVMSRGGSVEMIQMTSGDAFSKGMAALRRARHYSATDYRQYGSLRDRETVRSMRVLGVGRSRIRLLGFPDDGLCELVSERTSNVIFTSPYTHRDSPPPAEQIVPGAKYNGADLLRELARILVAFRPTLVVIPDAHDEHPDHCATHALAHSALALSERDGLPAPDVLHYLIHYRGWPQDAEARPPGFGPLRVLRLTDQERAGKERAVDAYRSQLTVMASFLHAFNRMDEVFAGADRDAAAPCWCRGQNIAAPRSVTSRSGR